MMCLLKTAITGFVLLAFVAMTSASLPMTCQNKVSCEDPDAPDSVLANTMLQTKSRRSNGQVTHDHEQDMQHLHCGILDVGVNLEASRACLPRGLQDAHLRALRQHAAFLSLGKLMPQKNKQSPGEEECSAEEAQGAWMSGRCSNLNGPSNECKSMQAGDTCGSGTATCKMDACCSMMGCTGPAPETPAPTQAPTVAPTEAATTPAPTVAPTQAPSKVPNSIDVMVPSGAKLLPVVSSAGFSIGDKIVIDAGTPIEEYNTIIGFGSLVLATPLKYDHAPGTIVSPVTHTGSAGATAPLNAAGFKSTTALCCPPEMEVFFTRLLESKGLKVCSIPHLQGLMHWFSCVPDMDFQYVIDVIENGNPCKYWAPAGESCPELSPLCSGHYCR